MPLIPNTVYKSFTIQSHKCRNYTCNCQNQYPGLKNLMLISISREFPSSVAIIVPKVMKLKKLSDAYCIFYYRKKYPTNMVTTVPLDRNMICIGTRYVKLPHQIIQSEVKNKSTTGKIHLDTGTVGLMNPSGAN